MSEHLLTRALLALALTSGCDDELPPPTIEVWVVTAEGGDPFAGRRFDALTLEVAQGDRPPVRIERAIDDDFDLSIAFDGLTDSTRVRVHLEGPDDTLHGAPPAFVPVSAGGLVNLVVGPPARCQRVPDARLPTGRRQRPMVLADTFVLALGGVEGAEPRRGVTSVDLLRQRSVDDVSTMGALPALVGAGGAGVAAVYGAGRVALASELGAVRYDLGAREAREQPLSIHAGAGPTSVALSVGDAAVIIGGEAARATWITADERLLSIALAARRASAAAAAIGGVAIVAGGDAPDAPAAELLRPSRDSSEPFGETDGVRVGPALVAAGGRLWLVGGRGADGELRDDTILVLGCPDACRVEPGPTWADPREGAVAAGPYLVAGDRIDQMAPDGTLTEIARLTAPRRAPLVVPYESGVLAILGGEDAEGTPLRDIELCFPPELNPL